MDKQQLHRQVHPVSAHLLTLGNKFLPEVGVSALYFLFIYLLIFSCTHCICTNPDVALLHSPRTELQNHRSSLFLSTVYGVTEQRPHMG